MSADSCKIWGQHICQKHLTAWEGAVTLNLWKLRLSEAMATSQYFKSEKQIATLHLSLLSSKLNLTTSPLLSLPSSYSQKSIFTEEKPENQKTYCGTVFLHWVSQFVTFGGPSREKTVLADVKVETFQTSVSVNNTDILKIH